jgi:hypothetical protein
MFISVSSPRNIHTYSIIFILIPDWLRWAGELARIEKARNSYRVPSTLNFPLSPTYGEWDLPVTLICWWKGKVIHGLNKLSTMLWRCMGKWRYSSIILDLNTRRKWVVSFTPLPFYSPGKQSPIPIVWGWWNCWLHEKKLVQKPTTSQNNILSHVSD